MGDKCKDIVIGYNQDGSPHIVRDCKGAVG